MRIIAGIYKGRRLRTLSGQQLRPTSDRLRETLFNILAPRIEESVFLDAFAGSGAIGIEALSRGAKRAVFIESSRRAIPILEDNIEHCGIEEDGRVIPRDTIASLKFLASNGEQFDIIYVDPPYESGLYDSVMRLISERSLVADDGIVITERRKGGVAVQSYGDLRPYREVVQGDSVLTFYSREIANSSTDKDLVLPSPLI